MSKCMDTYKSFMIQKCTFLIWYAANNISDFVEYINEFMWFPCNINDQYIKHLWYAITNFVMLPSINVIVYDT